MEYINENALNSVLSDVFTSSAESHNFPSSDWNILNQSESLVVLPLKYSG